MIVDNGLTIGPSLETLDADFNSEGFYEYNANPAPTPEPAPAAQEKLFAGKYKTAEDMEAATWHSPRSSALPSLKSPQPLPLLSSRRKPKSLLKLKPLLLKPPLMHC